MDMPKSLNAPIKMVVAVVLTQSVATPPQVRG